MLVQSRQSVKCTMTPTAANDTEAHATEDCLQLAKEITATAATAQQTIGTDRSPGNLGAASMKLKFGHPSQPGPKI